MESFDCRISCKYDTNYNYLYCRTETYYKRFNSGCSKIKKTGEVKMSTFYEDNMNIKKINGFYTSSRYQGMYGQLMSLV